MNSMLLDDKSSPNLSIHLKAKLPLLQFVQSFFCLFFSKDQVKTMLLFGGKVDLFYNRSPSHTCFVKESHFSIDKIKGRDKKDHLGLQ